MRRGWELWHELREVVPLPEKRHGGLIVAWTKDEALRLAVLQERAAINGVVTKILTPKEVSTSSTPSPTAHIRTCLFFRCMHTSHL